VAIRTQTEIRPSSVSQCSCEGLLQVGSNVALPHSQPPPGFSRTLNFTSGLSGCVRVAWKRAWKASTDQTCTALPRESAQNPGKHAAVIGALWLLAILWLATVSMGGDSPRFSSVRGSNQTAGFSGASANVASSGFAALIVSRQYVDYETA